MTRGDIHWASLPAPAGRRPVVILTRDSAIPVRRRVAVAEVTRTIRGTAAEVAVGAEEGLPQEGVVNCDGVATLPKSLIDDKRAGRLSPAKIAELDQALRFALGIVY